MADLLRTIIVDSDAESAALVRRILAAHPSMAIVGEFTHASEAAHQAPARRPDLMIVDVEPATDGADPDAAARLIESLARALPGSVILATGPGVSAEFVIQIIRAGALEFIRRPVQRDDFLAALDKVLRLRRGISQARRPGHVISVFSTKGGLGVTTLATNLAVCVAERSPGSTMLVDLDARHSDTATFLNLQPSYSIVDALENLERLDESFLRGLVSKHASGLVVLCGPSRLERSPITASQVEAGLTIIRSYFDHVVLDLRHDFDPATIAALEASDTILFLTGLNVSALRSGGTGLAAFRHLGLDLKKVRIVVMREDTGADVTVKHAREALGLPIFWKIPSDYPAVVASINRGEPVVLASPRSKVTKSLRDLCTHLGRGPSAPGKTSPGRAATLARLVWSTKPLVGDG